MEDWKSTSTVEDEQVIAAAQLIVKTLKTKKNLGSDVMKILSDLDHRFSTISQISKHESQIEERLDAVEEIIMSWDSSDQTMIWDCDPEEASKYLKAVDEVLRLIKHLENLSLNDGKANELLLRAHSVLQMAMARLEQELIHILVQNRQALEPDHVSFHSSKEDAPYEDYSINSVDEDLTENTRMKLRRDDNKESEEFVIDLINPDVIPHVKSIVDLMFISNYDMECGEAYISVRKDALDECLCILEVEKSSIEEVLMMDWNLLNYKMMKWIRAMKIFVRVYLASEKRLCEQIFGGFGSVKSVFFVKASKSSILQLLNYGEAIAVAPRLPEMLFRTLDMYEGWVDLLPDIDALFSEEAGSFIPIECREVIRRLGDSVRATLMEFKNAVRTKTSTTPFMGGGTHHLTKYVMNYLKALTYYHDSLNLLLVGNGKEDHLLSLFHTNMIIEEDREGSSSSSNVSPMAQQLQSVTSILESNLADRSKLYRDRSLEHFFLMNNIYYMVEKVKGSNLATLLGEVWIRQHNVKFRQHAISYERASWSPILSILKDDGICHPGSSSVSKSVLKERFRCFNLAFEELYKTQTAWSTQDFHLRDDLRISLSLNVLQAYRTFLGRNSKHGDKYIKYSAEDLQNYLLDLFEGIPKSLQNRRQR